MTPELITAIAGVIGAITALIIAIRANGNAKKVATEVAHHTVAAEIVSHFYHDHLNPVDLEGPNAALPTGDSPETPTA